MPRKLSVTILSERAPQPGVLAPRVGALRYQFREHQLQSSGVESETKSKTAISLVEQQTGVQMTQSSTRGKNVVTGIVNAKNLHWIPVGVFPQQKLIVTVYWAEGRFGAGSEFDEKFMNVWRERFAWERRRGLVDDAANQG
ncbi:hypothetical protein L198_06893 [Cryptococcus wingfieldii CBS 7118]|uniref:Uncharacterized protein n=1 Tax=Cryptococcus wingfieldii CBS 7118 TaxID=1295528 RepID=A0A1E3IHW7_9TREE|nr:hypothetical protein L198_06893 [Cryptococcus wingfieldii CBS 7118]ODN88128.1 hypothetical protein L198_06893 [Cryptococcus wingfieldii CBS 7118]